MGALNIALDYDGTWTEHPAFWDAFRALARGYGHKVTIVTMRTPSEPVEASGAVIYTSRRAKLKYAEENGIDVDIWIDDNPGWLFTDG